MSVYLPRFRPTAMSCHLVTPAPPGSLHGNRMTALRWQRHLRALGLRTSISDQWNNESADLLIALHARRSHAAIERFRTAHPERPVVLILTGTDLYRDLCGDDAARAAVLASMQAADRLVTLQQEAIDSVPASLHDKVVTIHQSVPPLPRQPVGETRFLVTVIGHLRDEKDPFCIVRALRRLPDADALRVLHLGKAMDDAHRVQAEQAMQADPRYAWRGELPHKATLHWLATSSVMVISSRMEGGAHVVSEAISASVPVLASDIPGNRGLLGADYPGCFPVGDDAALAALLVRAMTEPEFIAQLTRAVGARRALVSPDTERAAISRLIHGLIPGFDVVMNTGISTGVRTAGDTGLIKKPLD